MEQMAPEGPVYQAGTLSGNPLAMAAGAETLRELARPGSYEKLGALADQLATGLREAAAEVEIPLCSQSLGGMFGFFFHAGPVHDFEQARQADAACFQRFFRGMLKRGVYLAPSPFEAGFVSLAHRPADLRATLAATRATLASIARAR